MGFVRKLYDLAGGHFPNPAELEHVGGLHLHAAEATCHHPGGALLQPQPLDHRPENHTSCNHLLQIPFAGATRRAVEE